MSDQSLDSNTLTEATEATGATAQENQGSKTYTQEEFDRHMAGMKSSLTKKYEKVFNELGDIDELRQLKTQAEAKKLEDAKKRGDFERVIQELAAKKDAEILKRDSVIKEYKVNTPLLSAAAQYRAVNAEQVKSLLSNNVRLNADGEVEVVGANGEVRFKDTGTPMAVEDLVREFLAENPHFVSAAPATSNTKSSISTGAVSKLDVSKLDMKNPEHRELYRQYRKDNGIA
jgi:hypothetical protein